MNTFTKIAPVKNSKKILLSNPQKKLQPTLN